MKTLTFLSLVLSWALACSSSSNDKGQYSESPGRAAVPSMDQGESGGAFDQDASTAIPETEQKIIRDGKMYITVQDIQDARLFAEGIVRKYNARTSGENFENNDYQATYYMKIRIPAAQLDSLVLDLESIEGVINSKTIDARDVTEEYIDLETRLANKQSYLEQYRALLKNARTTEDILKVTEEIRQIEEELESAKGRLRYLADQVALSTLELTLTQTKDYVYRPDRSINFFERFKESVSDGWYGFVNFSLQLVRIWPFLLFFIVAWIVLRRMMKRKSAAPKP